MSYIKRIVAIFELNDIITTLSKNEEVLIFGIDDEYMMNSDKHYITHLKQYYKKIYEKDIKEKIIIKKNGILFDSGKNTKVKFLDNEIIGNTAFEVYSNKVAIFLWGIPNHLILIENKEVAQSYRAQFNILWNHAKELGNQQKS